MAKTKKFRTSPLALVKERFGSKEALVSQLKGLVDAPDGESDEEFAARLKTVANRKLLHLHAVGEKAKAAGGRDALVAKIAEFRGQAKDTDFVKKLSSFSLAKLLDLHGTAARAAK